VLRQLIDGISTKLLRLGFGQAAAVYKTSKTDGLERLGHMLKELSADFPFFRGRRPGLVAWN